MLTLKEGTELVKFARKTIQKSFLKKKPRKETRKNLKEEQKKFNKKQGVFVTLLKYPSHELRGCIGFPYPSLPLSKAVEEAAKSAAFSDFRFLPLQKNELKDIVIEISVLTVPREIKCRKEDLCKSIKIGRDGLIVSYHECSGLLLPQVPAEWNWNPRQFLEQTCMKANLYPEAWQQQDCKIYKFQAQIFAEINPVEKVIEKN